MSVFVLFVIVSDVVASYDDTYCSSVATVAALLQLLCAFGVTTVPSACICVRLRVAALLQLLQLCCNCCALFGVTTAASACICVRLHTCAVGK